MKAKRVKAKPAKKAKKVVSTPAKNPVASKLQKEVAAEIAAYMKKHDIGFNEFARRLGTSATQMQKIQKGAANLTFASLAQIAAVMKKKIKITFA